MIKSESGRGLAAMLVREVATARQIWMTAVGMPMAVTDHRKRPESLKYRGLTLMMERPLR